MEDALALTMKILSRIYKVVLILVVMEDALALLGQWKINGLRCMS